MHLALTLETLPLIVHDHLKLEEMLKI